MFVCSSARLFSFSNTVSGIISSVHLLPGDTEDGPASSCAPTMADGAFVLLGTSSSQTEQVKVKTRRRAASVYFLRKLNHPLQHSSSFHCSGWDYRCVGAKTSWDESPGWLQPRSGIWRPVSQLLHVVKTTNRQGSKPSPPRPAASFFLFPPQTKAGAVAARLSCSLCRLSLPPTGPRAPTKALRAPPLNVLTPEFQGPHHARLRLLWSKVLGSSPDTLTISLRLDDLFTFASVGA